MNVATRTLAEPKLRSKREWCDILRPERALAGAGTKGPMHIKRYRQDLWDAGKNVGFGSAQDNAIQPPSISSQA